MGALEGAGQGAAAGAMAGPWGMAIGAGIGAVGGMYSAKKQSNAAEHSANLQASGAQSALDFQKQAEAQRHAEWQQTQDKNFALYQDQQERLAPYRAIGAAAVGQLGKPIYGASIGDLAGKR